MQNVDEPASEDKSDCEDVEHQPGGKELPFLMPAAFVVSPSITFAEEVDKETSKSGYVRVLKRYGPFYLYPDFDAPVKYFYQEESHRTSGAKDALSHVCVFDGPQSISIQGRCFVHLTAGCFGSSFRGPEGDIRYVCVPRTVTEIPDKSFERVRSLECIVFASNSSLCRVGARAFYESGLQRVEFPDTLTELGDECLAECCNLEFLGFGVKQPVNIGQKVLYCSSIQYVLIRRVIERTDVERPLYLPKIASIGESCLSFSKYKFVSFASGSTLTHFANNLFSQSALSQITVPNTVTEIEGYCFHQCTRLQIVLFEHVSSVRVIGQLAFAWTGIERISIPDSVRILGRECFLCCKSLSTVEFGYHSSLDLLGDSCFRGSGIEQIRLPIVLRGIGRECFIDCSRLESFTWKREPGKRFAIPFLVFSGVRLFDGAKKLRFRNWFDMIPFLTFEGVFICASITYVHIPFFVTTIEKSCFAACSSLSRVTFDANSRLTVIGNDAFFETAIPAILIPDTVVCIGDGCFGNCYKLHYVSFGRYSQLISIGSGAFSGTAIERLDVPDSVVRIGDYCFALSPRSRGTPLNSVKVTSRSAFGMCYSLRPLSKISFGKNPSLTSLGSQAFMETALTDIKIPDSVVTLGSECFYECLLLTSVTFGDCPSIEILPNSAFKRTVSLRVFLVPQTVILIECDCFFRSGIVNVLFDTGSVLSEIGPGAFADSNLASFKIPESVTKISVYAFRFCPIRTFDTSENKKYLVNDTGVLLFRGNTGNCIIGRVSALNRVIIPKVAKKIVDGCFARERSIKELVFEEQSELVCIGKQAFQDTCIELIEIPASVRTLDDSCFAWCQQLRLVAFQAGSVLRTIGARAFEEALIKELNIPASVVSIGPYCFYRCVALCSITFPEDSSLQSIGEGAFSTMGLRNVTIPASVVSLGARCFRGAAFLKSVVFADGSVLQSIGQEAFCLTCVKELIIPASVVKIGWMAFGACDKLLRVLFKNPPTWVDSSLWESVWFNHPEDIEMHVFVDDEDEEEEGTTCWLVNPFRNSDSEDSSDYEVNSGPGNLDSDDSDGLWGWDSD